jgi:protein arginine kinase activator
MLQPSSEFASDDETGQCQESRRVEETMPKCQDCQQPATVHISRVVDGSKEELHLCRACAEKRKVLTADAKLELPVLSKKVVGAVQVVPTELAKLVCPDCGMTYMEFRKTGRLGCPYDYIVFRAGLVPLIHRVHRTDQHRGKSPLNLRMPIEQRGEMRKLRYELRRAIDAEDFERAARLRDLIRTKETTHGPQ